MFTAAILFYYATYLSNSIYGGLITILFFFYNHNECTRVQWTPPLRESFAYPMLLFQMYNVTLAIRKYTKQSSDKEPTSLKTKTKQGLFMVKYKRIIITRFSTACSRYNQLFQLLPGYIRLDDLQPMHLAVLAFCLHHANRSDTHTKVAEDHPVRLL